VSAWEEFKAEARAAGRRLLRAAIIRVVSTLLAVAVFVAGCSVVWPMLEATTR
jgi:hypothetical protein